jgi:hypothetical protein
MSDRAASKPSPPQGRARVVWLAIWTARLVAGGVFIYAAIPKLIDPAAFAEDIGNYQAFPYQLDNLLATIVPLMELLGGLALISGIQRRGGSLLLSGLTMGFLVLILSVIVRDIDLASGCDGASEDAANVGWPLFFRDLGLLAATVIAGLRRPGADAA